MIDKTKLHEQLMVFGILKEEVQIYLHLLQKGSLSVLQLSRDLNIGRTKIYNHIDKLSERGFVNQILTEKGKRFEANDPKVFELDIFEEEENLQSLQNSLSKIIKELQPVQELPDSQVDFKYYTGAEGLKQVTWNSLKAKKELYIFEIAQGMHPFSGQKFAEKMREELFLRKIVTKQLSNISKFKPFTKVENYVKHCMQVRYIPPKELKMDFEILIYNDVVAFYTYEGKDIFCIEIYNAEIAEMQKQIFLFFWNRAQKMKVSKGGKAEVIRVK